MPPVTWVPRVMPPGATTALAALDADAATCPEAPAKVHFLLAYRRDTLVIETRPLGPAVTPHHA